MNEQIISIVLMMQEDLKTLNLTATHYLDVPEFEPEIEEFVRGYYQNGKDALERVFEYVEKHPEIYEQTGDEFRMNVRLMKEIKEKVQLIEQRFKLR